MTTTQYLNRDGGRIAYDDTGTEGPMVVCVPGMGDTRKAYRHLRPLLTAAGYRVVTADLRGEGDSDATFADYSTTAVAADILALVRHLNAGPALLISNSYTGGPSYVVAAEAPDLFTAIVLTAPFARVQPAPTFMVKLALWYVTHFASGWTTYWGTLFKTRKPADFAETKKALTAKMREPGRLAALRGMTRSQQAPGEAAAPRVKCPVLVVGGTLDPDFKDPAGEAKIVAGMVANGRVEMIEGAGHYPATEFPQETANAILQFLESAR